MIVIKSGGCIYIEMVVFEEFGSLTHYDYGFRIYNPSIARFLSVDPLAKSYPWYTPYQFASNSPIEGIDLDGLEYARASGNAATENMTARDQSAAYIIPTPVIKPKVKVEQQVMVQDIHGNVTNIPESQVQAFNANQIREYKSMVLENIRTGGIITSVTYLLTRDEALTFETGNWDNLLISAAAFPNGNSSVFPKVSQAIKFPFLPKFVGQLPSVKIGGKSYLRSLNEIQKGYEKAGYKKILETPNNVMYEVPTADGKGTFYSRLQRGVINAEGFKVDRVVNTRNNGDLNNKDYVKPDGSTFNNKESKETRSELGHILLNGE